MKRERSLFLKWAAYGAALFIASAAITAEAQSKSGSAKVQSVRGTAQFQEAGGPWANLTVGKILGPGAVIKTALGAVVDLYLKQNGPVVRVTEETTLSLEKLLYDETADGGAVVQTLLDLKNGRILGNVKKLAAASKYEVKIPTGTVGIRGTTYDISTRGIVHVFQGTVLITLTGPTGTVIWSGTVNAGQTFTAGVAGAPPTVGPTPAGVTQQGTVFRDVVNTILTDNGETIKVEPTVPPTTPPTDETTTPPDQNPPNPPTSPISPSGNAPTGSNPPTGGNPPPQ